MEKSQRIRQARGTLLLVLTAFIWGTAFVAQSVGMDHVGPFTFNGVRNLVACVALSPVIFFFDFTRKKKNIVKPELQNKLYIKGGIICGVFLFAASSLQQIGIMYTTAGKAGFLTALYIVFVPVLGIFFRKKTGPVVWICVIIALAGAYLLSVKEGFSIAYSDIYLLICAVLFAWQIIFIDKYAPLTDNVKLSFVQFLTTGIISTVIALIAERPSLTAILACAGPILYTAVMSSGVAYTLQIVGQKDTPPAIASLVMSLESVFSALAGWVVLNEVLSPKETLGCVLVFAAVILSQLPFNEIKEKLLSKAVGDR